MARYLANKCSIASRIDCFAGKFLRIPTGSLHFSWMGSFFLGKFVAQSFVCREQHDGFWGETA